MEYQASPFEPIRTFDIPGVALHQFLEGTATPSSLWNLTVPSKRANLTPQEQLSLTEKLKNEYGGDNRALRTMIGIATNPWVWLGFAFSPAGVDALRAGRSVFGSGRHVAKYINNNGTFLDHLGGSTFRHISDNTKLAVGAEADALQRAKFLRYADEDEAEFLVKYYSDPARKERLTKLGFKEAPRNLEEILQVMARSEGLAHPKKFTPRIFDPRYKPRKEHEGLANDIRRLVAIGLSGRQRATKEILSELQMGTYYVMKEADLTKGQKFLDGLGAEVKYKGPGRYAIPYQEYETLHIKNQALKKAGKTEGLHDIYMDPDEIKIMHETIELPPLMDEAKFNALANDEIKAIIGSKRNVLDKAVTRLMGDEQEMARVLGREFKLSERKLTTLISALDGTEGANLFLKGSMEELVQPGMLNAKGSDILATLLNREVHQYRMSTFTKKENLMRLLEGSLLPSFSEGNYLPRNTFKSAGSDALSSEYVLRGATDTSSLAETSRLMNRTIGSRRLHPEDYEWLINHSRQSVAANPSTHNRAVLEGLLHDQDKVIKAIGKNEEMGIESLFLTLDGINSTERYLKDSSEMWSRYLPHLIQDPMGTGRLMHDPAVYGKLRALDNTIKRTPEGMRSSEGVPLGDIFKAKTPWRAPADWVEGKEIAYFTDTLDDLMSGNKRHLQPAGGITLADIMGNDWVAFKNNHAKGFFRDTLLPHMSGRLNPQQASMRSLQATTRAQLETFAESRLGETIRSWGKPGEDFIDGLLDMSQTRSISGSLAKGLYVGFLGVNMSSVMLNLMQPLLHATMFGGLDNVLPAYKDAFLEIMDYGAQRMKSGKLIISDRERARAMEKSFEFVDSLGMSPDVFGSIDIASYAGTQRYGVESGLKYATQSLPMKLFEKAELLNRNVAAHTMKRMYQKAGRKVPTAAAGKWSSTEEEFYRFRNDVDTFVQETQFGGTPINMPTAFMGEGPLGKALSNPLGRQFLSFPTRAFTSWLQTGKRISPTRRIRGTDIQVHHTVADMLRLMGTGAVIYEFGKEMLGTDLSRGVGVQPIFEVMDAGFVPPIVKLPMDFIEIVTGDLELAKSSLPAVFPGGISAVRAMGMLPKLGDTYLPDMANSLQRTYVDWDTQTPDGYRPVYSGDGRLISYDSPFTIITRGLGLKLEDHPRAGEVDGYLLSQRDIINKMTGDYMNALLTGGNVSKARGIEAEFKKKFGVPLTVSKDQWRRRIRNLQVARTERIADSLPAAYKSLYQSTLVKRYREMGLASPEEAMAGMTSGARTKAGAARPETVTLSPEAVEEIRNHMKKLEQEKPIEEQGFDPFKAWNQ